MDVDRTTWDSTLVKNHDENKTFILVKLSESFSNAIQEYSAPTIKFHGPRGAIKFPNGKSYDFSLEESDNSVECIRQTKNRWESVGKIARCLHIKGKDDVYQRTRTKMEAAEQEKRKYCTKLLGSPEQNNTSTTATPATTEAKLNHSNPTIVSSQQNSLQATTNNHHNNHHHHHQQLKRYKTEFNKDYKEYQNLHGYLHGIEERFKKLRESLKQSVEGSAEWESAKEEIFSEYERVKGDSNFHRARSKYKQLHNKLAHIKEKIFQFKREHRDKCNSRKKRKR